jgi:predicted small metal-binding protein
MPRITCSDLGLGACEHVLENEDEVRLLALAREHAREKHGVELSDEELQAALVPGGRAVDPAAAEHRRHDLDLR